MTQHTLVIAESGAVPYCWQRIVDERTQRAADLEHHVAMMEVRLRCLVKAP